MFIINTHKKHYYTSNIEEQTDVPSGITMKFDNGNTISIQWGSNSYSSNKGGESKDHTLSAEIAIWNKEGDWYVFNSRDEDYLFPETVKGWCDTTEVAYWIYQASTMVIEGGLNHKKILEM